MKVVCRNSATGRGMTFDYGDVVFLQDVEDIGTADYTNETSKNTGVNGVTVEGESQDERHPIIRAVVMSNYDVIRDQLDAVFQKGVDGTLMVYRDDGSCRVATYRPEGWELPQTGIVRDLTVKLLCADPLFYDPEEAFTTMAAWRSLFKFPLTFQSPSKFPNTSQICLRPSSTPAAPRKRCVLCSQRPARSKTPT